MYWKHNNPTSPQIEAVLNKEDVTLQDLMDEEDILQECKSQNKKLIEFLVRPEVMEELVTLTTVEPSKDLDERLRYKYSNIACELLTSDVPALNERLANDGILLGKLYYFLESDPPLNPLLASYFSKTLSMLVSQRTEQVLEFLKSKENFVSLLVKHLGTSAIMDLMLKLITNIEGVEIKQNILNWLDSEHIVQSLIELLHPSVDPDRQCNAAQLLSDIIAKSRDNTLNTNERSNSDPIIATLESSETVTLLLNNILGSDQTESSIVSGIQVLLALLNFNKNNPSSIESNYEQIEVSAEKEHRERVIHNVNNAIISRLKDFHHILIEPPKKAPIQTTVGLLDPPFGNTRLQVTKLLAALLASNSIDVKNEIAKLGTVNVLLDLFFKYTWNNFLHTQVQNCIAYALAPVTKIDEFSENTMYHHIIVECRLLGRILEAWDDNEQIQSEKKGVRRGYMGHLINIANNVAEQWDKTPLGEFIVANVNSETVESWKKFVSGPLEEINKKHKIILGGVHPSNSLANDNADEYREIPFPPGGLQTSYTDFSRLQASTSQYIEVYGYNDDEDAQACSIFDKVCAETMNSFDNVDDDDDLWENQGLSSLNEKQHKDWQRRNPDADDPMINKLDSTIVDPWKNDEPFTDPTVAPLAEADPWSTNSSSGAVSEGWANFDAFTDFETTFNTVSSNSSNFLDTFTQPFDFKAAAEETSQEPPENFITSSPNEVETPQNVNNDETQAQQQQHQQPPFTLSENVKDSFDSDDNANINQNSKTPEDDLIDNFQTYLSNALTDDRTDQVSNTITTSSNDVTTVTTESAPEIVVKNSTETTTEVSQKVQEKLQEITTVHENESSHSDTVLNQVTEAN